MTAGIQDIGTRREVEWTLRMGVFLCFVGHGAFGLLRKPAWLDYFAAVGIAPDIARVLMPVVGTVDVLVGLAALVRPVRPVLYWATFWGLTTALLRPFAGEPVWEVLERAGNYGVPLALLVLITAHANPGRAEGAAWTLRVATSLLLLGHGALALAGKPLLVGHVLALGLPATALPALGALEVGLAIIVAVAPFPALLVCVAAWKLATESLFPLTGAPAWEFVERGGSVAAPLGLAFLLRGRLRAPAHARRAPVPLRTHVLLGVMAVAAGAAAPAQAQEGDEAVWAGIASEVPTDARLEVLARDLREGGLVLLCRHAITDHDARDTGPTRAEQRNLSAAGREQSRLLGRAIREMGIPIGDVRASPAFRTMDTAELAFGTVRGDSTLAGREHASAMRGLLTERPAGGNRVLVSHQGTIRRVVPIGRAPLEEGDCLVIRPSEDTGFDVLARLAAGDWARIAR